jgi:hypothetical protein
MGPKADQRRRSTLPCPTTYAKRWPPSTRVRTSFDPSRVPSWQCELDSRHPLHGKIPARRSGSTVKRCSGYCGPDRSTDHVLEDRRRAGSIGSYRRGRRTQGRPSSLLNPPLGDVPSTPRTPHSPPAWSQPETGLSAALHLYLSALRVGGGEAAASSRSHRWPGRDVASMMVFARS